MRASTDFLAVVSPRISYRVQEAPDTARDSCSLLSASSNLLCSLRSSATSSPSGTNTFYCCATSYALTRWPTRICVAPDARGRTEVQSNFFGLKRNTGGFLTCFNVSLPFELLSKGRPLGCSRDGVPASFVSVQLTPKRHSCRFTDRVGLCRPMSVARENAFIRESAAWPRNGHTVAFGGASAAQAAAQQVSEKDPSHLFDALKRLRSLTGCSVVACREALLTSEGDIHAAVDWLRRKGMAGAGTTTAQASDTAERLQAEGVVAVASWRPSPLQGGSSNRKTQHLKGGTPSGTSRRHEGEVAVKLSCSTDFVARNSRITHFARRAATLLAEHLQQVGLQDMLKDSAATAVHAEHRKGMRADIASPDHPSGRERPPSASVPQQPSQRSSGIIVVRGPSLVERLLSLSWNPGEEETKRGDSDAAETLVGAGNFFQEQQQMVGATSQQKMRQPTRAPEKAKGSKKEQAKREQLAEECSANEREHKGMQSTTIGEELQYLSSVVREPLSITDVLAMESPVESGVVASYLHGIVDNQVGTLAVLAALSIEHDKNKCDALTHHQQSSTRAAPATLNGMKERRRDSQGVQLTQQQLQQQDETRHKARGKRAEKEVETSRCQGQQTVQDGPQQRKQPSPETASNYELADRIRRLAEDVCMQIAAGKPVAVDEHSLDRGLLEREESIYRAQAEATGKPPVTIERMVAGKVNKWLKDVLLSRQTWLLDDSGRTVQQKLSEFAVQQHMEKVPHIETFVKIQVH